MPSVAIARLGVSGWVDALGVIFNKEGQVADADNLNWKSYSSDVGEDTFPANELGVSGEYQVTIPPQFEKDWWRVVFHKGSKASLAIASVENPMLTRTIPVESTFSAEQIDRILLALAAGNIVPGNTTDQFHIKAIDGTTNRVSFTRDVVNQSRTVTARNGA